MIDMHPETATKCRSTIDYAPYYQLPSFVQIELYNIEKFLVRVVNHVMATYGMDYGSHIFHYHVAFITFGRMHAIIDFV
jgi:hypothetical protein